MSNALSGKKILLGVTGSIAAYKSAFLLRLLVKAGASVKVIMTEDATHFITPLTLQTLSGHAVLSAISTDEAWNNHVELGLWADVMLIAPLTANTLAKMAQGQCDNMLTASYLSCRAPVFIAPAMDLDMWSHPATKRNLQQLLDDGVQLIPVGDGELASGLHGPGRMAEPEEIITLLEKNFKKKSDLKIKVLVTAGPTYEDIDPVRFIGNRSSGKMGWAIARAFANRGAEVSLIMGPSTLDTKHDQIQTFSVRSAAEMADVTMRLWPNQQVAILAAAVADFTPAHKSNHKIKKQANNQGLTLELKNTKDIAKEIGAIKKPDQISIGFALETRDGTTHAKSKLSRKNFDMIVLNTLADKGAGFQHDTNKVSFLFAEDSPKTFPLKLKTEIAEDIVDQVEKLITQKQHLA